MPNAKLRFRKKPKAVKMLPKVVNFRQIWSHCSVWPIQSERWRKNRNLRDLSK